MSGGGGMMANKRRGGARRPPSTAKAKRPLALEILLKAARGEALGGRVPTLAQRLRAAQQALPYLAACVAPAPGKDDQDKKLVVTVVRFGDEKPPS